MINNNMSMLLKAYKNIPRDNEERYKIRKNSSLFLNILLWENFDKKNLSAIKAM